jgi:hypothetical protein
MEKTTRYVGLDVHGETIAAALGEGQGKARSLGQFPNRPESVRKFIEQLGGPAGLKICYEAGPTGYALYWQLTKMGVACEVVAPSLVPRKPGEKIKDGTRSGRGEAGPVFPERHADFGVGARCGTRGAARSRVGASGRQGG